MCQSYSQCLDKAIQNGSGWSCAGCLHEEEWELIEEEEIIRCSLFLYALWRRHLYRVYRQFRDDASDADSNVED